MEEDVVEEAEDWSEVAAGWGELWGAAAEPAWWAVAEATGIGPGTRVLDVGCGSGDFLAHVVRLGAVAAGVDPASGMVRVARTRAPGADVRHGWAHDLPWPDHSMDVVTVFNALHLVDDPDAALAEAVRVAVPGGLVAVAGWAEGAGDDLDVLQAAVRAADGEDPAPSAALPRSDGPERHLAAAGLAVTAAGVVEAPWAVPDDATLVRGVLLGEDLAGMAALGPAVVAAARPFRTAGGGYRLVNTVRWAVGRTAARPAPEGPAQVRRPTSAEDPTGTGGSAEAPPPASRSRTVR